MQFPAVTGSNLQREKLSLPEDFQGKLNLVLVAFQQWQQREVDSWIPFARQLERSHPEVIEASRRRRIARGSGTEPQDVSGLIKSFAQARDMMKAMADMSMMDRMKAGTKFAQMSMAGGKMPKLKGLSKASRRKLDRKEKRRRRKKGR